MVQGPVAVVLQAYPFPAAGLEVSALVGAWGLGVALDEVLVLVLGGDEDLDRLPYASPNR